MTTNKQTALWAAWLTEAEEEFESSLDRLARILAAKGWAVTHRKARTERVCDALQLGAELHLTNVTAHIQAIKHLEPEDAE